MKCTEFVELVTAYLEDQLSPDGRAAFEEHMRLCRGCDTYLAQFRTTISLLGQLPEESISSAARTQLLGAFADWRSDGAGDVRDP